MLRSRLLAIGVLGAASWVTAGGCSSSNDGGTGAHGGGTAGNTALGGSGGTSPVVMPGTSGDDAGGKNQLNPLCGVADISGVCVPDNASACLGYVPPFGSGGEAPSGVAGFGAGGDASSSGGQGGAPNGAGRQSSATGGEGGADSSGQAGALSGGAGGAGGDNANQPPVAHYSCQVASQNNLLTRQCVPAGTGVANAPCFTAADCAPSFACVTSGDAGRCLPYCCDPATTCAPGTYCAEQPLRRTAAGNDSTAAPRVPVCVPADGCSLEDKFPCPAGKDCRCQGDTACMVVRSDGTTACVKPGTGEQGDPCPCAWNHICSSVTNQCVKICRTDASASDCGSQKCQASAELPPNFGVCVGPTP